MTAALPLSQENWIRRIPLAEYNALPAERYSHLKHILTSPRHYLHAKENDKQTPAMVKGDATHAAVLEPDRFASDYLVYPGAVRRGKEWDAWSARHAEDTIITASEREAAVTISKAVRADPACMRYLAAIKQVEVAMHWIDPVTGIACKARIDAEAEIDGGPCVVGLKTAKATGKRKFIAQACDLLYLMQWAMYWTGYRIITGRTPKMVEIAVENHEPFDPVPYTIREGALAVGLTLYQRALVRLVDARRDNRWLGQSEGKEQEIDFDDLPGWAPGVDGADFEVMQFPGLEGEDE